MKIHILFDGAGLIKVFVTKKKLIKYYVEYLSENYPEHFHKTHQKLQICFTDADTEMFKAFAGRSFDASLIDLKEYFDKHDGDSSYVVQEL